MQTKSELMRTWSFSKSIVISHRLCHPQGLNKGKYCKHKSKLESELESELESKLESELESEFESEFKSEFKSELKSKQISRRLIESLSLRK